MNRFSLIGNLTKDPETKQLQNGTIIATLNIAQNKEWKDASGTRQKKTLFFQFTAFGKTAEVLEKYTKKGNKIYIEAEVEPYKRENNDGTPIYGVSFIIKEFEFLTPKSKNQDEEF